ncbi:hypothetical protein PV327_004111 [Microctonus hyperodae]|uniref:Vacuolar ATPase assembly integral membrane protein VMA21 homolog n=1 Tax=Microctonus hyperodae TaxID=165561 RepID=A0AA39FBQ3_MICHY|nr:hypothetical protein PV327_004111 [Microctonus hyperodae]
MNRQDSTEFQVFKTVLTYSLVIIIMPIMSFFVSRMIVFDALFGMSGTSSNVSAAIVAVLVLHGALGAFIYRAYFDGQTKLAPKID